MAFSLSVRDKITLDNLQMQEMELSSTLEARLSHLSDMALTAVLSLPPDTPVLDALLAARKTLSLPTGKYRLHREVLDANRALLESITGHLALSDEALFTKQLCRHLAARDRMPTLSDFFPAETGGGRIAYVGSSFTNDAYNLFSEKLESPRVVYCKDFEEACGAVTEGEAEYCILPFRDAAGRRIRTAAQLLEVYHLTVCDAVAIYDGEDEGREYALCGKTPLPLYGSYTLWLSLAQAEAEAVLRGAPYMGLALQEAHIQGDANLSFNGEGDPTPVLLWLSLFHSPYRVEGLYHNSAKEV
ncbi:MAG: hypothetical protein IJC29_03970 [Clostridia bacterium]|nr:hypothetical protein [Clostridia bacterium]